MSYLSEVLADGPAGYWKIGESSGGTAADSSGNSRNAAYNGGITLGQAALLSQDPATCGLFDGAGGSFVSVPYSAAFDWGTGDLAWECWLQTSGGGNYVVVGSFGLNPWYLGVFGGALVGDFTNAEGLVYATGGVADGLPHHIVVVRQSGVVKMYIDGARANSDTTRAESLGDGGTGFGIGASHLGNFAFPGKLGHVAVYGSALSASRVLAHYNAGTTVSTVTFAADDPRYRYSGRWAAGSEASTPYSGAYVDIPYTGQSCTALFNVSGTSAYPAVAVWVDGVGPARHQLDSGGAVTISPAYNAEPTGSPPYASVASAAHLVRVMAIVDAGNSGATAWSDGVTLLRFRGVHLDAGGDLLDIPDSPDQIEFLGDSLVDGVRLLYVTGGTDAPSTIAPEINWTEIAARWLGMRPIVTGIGGQGLADSGFNGAPAANAAFPYVCDGVAWNPATKPAVVVVYQGTNGATSQANYTAYLTTIRAAYPDARIFASVPHNKTGIVAAITASVAAMADANIHLLDYSAGVIDPAADQSDTLGHLNPGGAIKLAARFATDIRGQLDADGVKMQAGGTGGGTSYFAF